MKNDLPKGSRKPEFESPKIEDINARNDDESMDEIINEEESYADPDGLKKVLITGCKGQLGAKLQEVLSTDFEVAGVDLDEMDITNPDDVLACFYLHRPDIVIHAAAMTDVEGCEVTPEVAYRVNAIGTQNVVVGAREFNSTLVYLSTDYVFDGEKNSQYMEFDQVRPLNIYGKSKVLGEMAVRETLRNFFIVRTSWLIGPGKNFVRTILKVAQDRDEIRIVDDQTGKPTFAADLAIALKALINTPFYGTYHITNSGQTTWFKLAVKAVELAGLPTKVVPIMTHEYPTKARRPKNSALANTTFESRGLYTMPHWEDALKAYLREEGYSIP